MTSDEKPGSSILDASNETSSLPARLEPLAEAARDYARAATSTNTNRAYAADWRHYTAWCRRQNLPALPPDPQVLGLYIAACASGAAGAKPKNSVRTIERRLSALMWNFAQRGQPMDRKDRHVATVLAGIRRTQGRPPEQKEAVLPEDLLAMIATLDLGELTWPARPGDPPHRLRRRPEALGNRRPRLPRRGRPQRRLDRIFRRGPAADARGKTGWREVEIGRGSSEATCPVVALETWLKFARISVGPLFRRVVGGKVGPDRLTDRHVARLVKHTALAAGVRGDLTEGERERKFSGHSLRAGLASSAEVDERYVQKQLGHASAEMTRRYQRRRDRFRVNLTKAAGL